MTLMWRKDHLQVQSISTVITTSFIITLEVITGRHAVQMISLTLGSDMCAGCHSVFLHHLIIVIIDCENQVQDQPV